MQVGVEDRQVTARGGATRQRILRTTLELVGREGVAALSNRRIAAEAGVSLGSLTYHFTSQTEMLREALELHAEEEVARLEGIAAELRSRRPSRQEIAAEVQRLATETGGRLETLAELEMHLHAVRDPALRDASRRCFAAYEGLATTVLAALGVPDPSRHASAVVGVMFGMSIQRFGTGRDNAAALIDALRTIIRGARG